MYHFCRFVDDVADELPPQEATVELAMVVQTIKDQRLSNAPQKLQEILKLFHARGVDAAWVEQLILGVQSDLQSVDVQDEGELLRYAYRVAGVVGLMMCPVLGVKDPKAWTHAIDLGIAMQLSNIARDIEEDRLRGRNYIPKTWRSLPNQEQIRRLVNLSQSYYASARDGYAYLPWQARFSIAVAARLYSEIGRQVLARYPESLKVRVSVSRLKKLILTLREITAILLSPPKLRPHVSALHEALKGLPGSAR